jgi:hypothetical protein
MEGVHICVVLEKDMYHGVSHLSNEFWGIGDSLIQFAAVKKLKIWIFLCVK